MPALKKPQPYLKLPFVDMPHASEQIQQRGKKMRAACFPGCHFRSTDSEEKPLCREVLPPQMCSTPSGKRNSAFLGLLFLVACRASATCPCILVYASGRATHLSQAVEMFACWLMMLEEHVT